MNASFRTVFHNLGQRMASLPGGLAGKFAFRKNAVRILAAGVAVLGVAAACAADEPAGSAQAAGNVILSKMDMSPEATWQAIRPRLEQADRDSAKAVEAELETIKEFFAERKQGARRFAEEVLGWGGKLRAGFGIVNRMFDGLFEYFGCPLNPGEDHFTYYIRQCFREHVLDAGQLKKAINASVTGYAKEVQRIEAKLLVDLRADLDLAALPKIRAGGEVAGESGAMIAEAREAAVGDLVVEIGKQAVSWVLGNAIADRLTCDDDPFPKKAGINIGAGLAVDKALNAGLAKAGYDPEGALAAKIAASLDRMRDLVMNRDPKSVEGGFIVLRQLGISMSKPSWMRGGADQGLRERLLSIHAERSRLREEALRRMVFGPGAPR